MEPPAYTAKIARKPKASWKIECVRPFIKYHCEGGRDMPSVYQLKGQERERLAGGCYEFIRYPEQFILWYDGFVGDGT